MVVRAARIVVRTSCSCSRPISCIKQKDNFNCVWSLRLLPSRRAMEIYRNARNLLRHKTSMGRQVREKRVWESAVQPVGPTRAVFTVVVVVVGSGGRQRRRSSLYRSIPSVLTRRTGCAYTRAPASTHVADAGVRTRAERMWVRRARA